ncbi:hypothetical protein GCM10017559_61240 [Streptosporangium longisporum]|uniref:Uncharacterized protein n=1 Tax=Streptosporangium longisporum TaxID=46187 RepID=A0ABP6L1C1_9ACTN
MVIDHLYGVEVFWFDRVVVGGRGGPDLVSTPRARDPNRDLGWWKSANSGGGGGELRGSSPAT